MIHCMMKFGPLIYLGPIGEWIECLTVMPTLADRIQATAGMFNGSCRVWVQSSSNLETLVADL